MSENNKVLVQDLWKALGNFDWDTLKNCLHPEVHYRDAPSDDPGAHGPENCVKRLSIAWDHLKRQDQVTHRIAAEGDTVFLEHTEKWVFKTGETAEHTFVTVHEIRDGLVYRWTYSLLPIIRAFVSAAGIDVQLKDISLASRILAQFLVVVFIAQQLDDAIFHPQHGSAGQRHVRGTLHPVAHFPGHANYVTLL